MNPRQEKVQNNSSNGLVRKAISTLTGAWYGVQGSGGYLSYTDQHIRLDEAVQRYLSKIDMLATIESNLHQEQHSNFGRIRIRILEPPLDLPFSQTLWT